MYLWSLFLKCQHFRSEWFNFWCQQFSIASVIDPTCVSPSWWRWWHCSCCLCIASRAWRRHLSGIPARPYPAEDGKADRTVNSPGWRCARSERGVRLPIAVPTEGKYHTAFFNVSLQNVQGDLTPPTRSRLSAQEIFDAAVWDETELN